MSKTQILSCFSCGASLSPNAMKCEFCDNVKPSYGSSGQFGENKRGNGTVCSFGNLLLFGEKVGNDLIIKIVEFK